MIYLLGSLCAQTLEAQPTVRALPTEETIIVDGMLNEASWRLAQPATDFIQAEPRQGESSTERTEVRILYDSENLYFGVTCFDRDPQAIIANSLRRDFQPGSEDSFELLLDTFADFRNGYLFVTNPQGAKRDVQVSNEGIDQNVSWDAIWDVKTQVNQEGWIAEIRIPIKTLRYDQAQESNWNVNFGRRIRRKNEIVYWSEIPRRYQITRVSLAGQLLGLSKEDWRAGRNLQVTPYLVANLDENAGETSTSFDVGGDLKYGLTSGLTLDLTYNTDFSHVEVDRQQVNLDRFSLFFPEKRDFFLENSGIFEIGSVGVEGAVKDPEDPVVFYSRRIGLSNDPDKPSPVPILGGARLTGRTGAYQVGLLSLQTDRTADQGPENNTVLRVKRDVLARSWVGAFFLNRQGSERLTNRVYGVDGIYRPSTDLTFNSMFVQSQTSGVSDNDWTLRMEGEYNLRWMRFAVTHANIEEDYRNDLGFTPRTGISVTRVEVQTRIRPWQEKAIREIRLLANVRYVADSKEYQLASRKTTTGLDLSFQDGGLFRFRYRPFFERLDEDFEIRSGIVIPQADYHYTESVLEYTSDRSRILSGDVHWFRGDFWNGRKTSLRFGVQFRPSSQMSTQFSFSRDQVDLPAGQFDANLLGLRFNYAFNTHTFLDAFFQYNSEKDRVTSNARFNLIHHSLSDLFIVYTEQRLTGGQNGVDRLLSLKYTHLLSF